MKKNLFRIAALVLVGACMIACSSGDDEATNEKVNPQENKDNIVTLTGKIALPATTRSTVTEAGVSTWTAGDKIAVIYQNKFGSWSKAVGTISTGGNETSEFTVTLTNPVNCNAKLVYPADNATTSAPYYTTSTLSTQNGTLAEIGTKHNIQSTDGDYALVISGENATLNGGTAVPLANRVCITKFTLEYSDNSFFNASKLVVTGGGQTYTINPPAISNEFYVALPAINGDLTVKATGPTKFGTTTELDPNSVTTADYGKFIVVDPTSRQAYLAERTTSNEWTKTFSGASLAVGNFYKNTITFNGKIPVAVIAHVGAIKSGVSDYETTNAYCEKFLALALEDVYSEVKTISQAQALISNTGWCSKHAIKIGSDEPYNSLVGSNGKYDEVQECAQIGGTGDNKYKIDTGTDVTSASRTTAVDKGWRIPTVTDLRYIFDDLKDKGATGSKVMPSAVNATTPIGIMDHNGQYYSDYDTSSYSNGASLRNPINYLCGNNYLESQYYWLSSQVKNTSSVLQDTKAWRFSFNFNYFIWNEQADKSLARLVFAY